MARDRVRAELLGQSRGQPFCELARVDEYERDAMSADQPRHLGVELAPLLVAAHRRQRRVGHDRADVERAQMARVDDRALAALAGEQTRHVLERLLRRGKPDALHLATRTTPDQLAQALQR